MNVNELAAAVVGVDATDLQELARIHSAFEDLIAESETPASAKKQAVFAKTLVEQVILRDCEIPLDLLNRIADAVTAIQKAIEFGEPCEDPPDIGTGSGNAQAATPTEGNDAPGKPAPQSPPPNAPPPASDSLANDPALLNEFVTESLEHLERAEAGLLNLESNASDKESLNGIFRAFHTIKGTSGFLGLRRINAVAHKAEFLLDRARQGQIQLLGGYADLALASADMLRQLVESVRSEDGGESEGEPEGLVSLLARLDAPDREPGIQPDGLRVGDVLVARGVVSRDMVEAVATKATPGKIGEKLVQAGYATATDVSAALRTQKQAPPAAADSTLRVSMERLDRLINMVGELVIAQAMVGQDRGVKESKDQVFTRKVSHQGKITRELQDLTLSMRMVPLKSTFQKMARLVRDVSKKNGKDVQFVTDGEDTEIDRNMVDAIGDPLVHMMRNAVDHGIESPEDRAAGGKPAQGTVVLRAYHAGGKVVIEVQDDGKGLDPAKILAKARERGIVEPDRELSEAEIFDLLFVPGFSTADKVTDVSGRGVGMDVVKRNIEGMRGRVEINSKLGGGSTFIIRLPLTLAIIDGMILQVGHDHYVLPTLNIEQAFRPDRASISTVTGRGEMVLLRGQLIPIFRLHRLFNVKDAVQDSTEGLLVVIEHEGQRCALLADALLGQQQVVIKSLGSALGDVEGVSGAAILGDGRVGLILDAAGVLKTARGESTSEAA